MRVRQDETPAPWPPPSKAGGWVDMRLYSEFGMNGRRIEPTRASAVPKILPRDAPDVAGANGVRYRRWCGRAMAPSGHCLAKAGRQTRARSGRQRCVRGFANLYRDTLTSMKALRPPLVLAMPELT